MMLKTRGSVPWLLSLVGIAVLLAAGQSRAAAADNAGSPEATQRELLKLLQSDAPPQDKAIACKKLAIYGTKDAVPALAALLSDPQLSSWARIALEAIPDPSVDAALREAAGKLQGSLLVAVINSVRYRRDAQAIPLLANHLKDPNADVAIAAAAALGHIGGDAAARALEASLADAPARVRSAVAQACVECAERYLAEGKSADAVKLCDRVRGADVPKHVVLEATRGAILSRQSAGLPLLLEQVRSPDKAAFNLGLRAARELPGRDVTEALAAEIGRAAADRQPLILLAVADRTDAAVMPAVLQATRSSAPALQRAALGVLEHLGSVSSIPALLDAAVASDAALAKQATGVLGRLPGSDVDTDLLGRLEKATGKTRQVLLEVAGQRHLAKALPVVVVDLADRDAGIRRAAVLALGALGEAPQTADLVRLLQQPSSAPQRADLEKALLALGTRCGAACVPHVVPLMKNSEGAVRIIALQTLAAMGGTEALTAVRAALDDKDEAVQDEAVRTLSTWPNNWPDDEGVAEPLLALAKSGKKLSHQVLGLRGYLQFVQEDRKLKNDEKVARVTEVRPLLQRPDETRLAIAALGNIPAFSALEQLVIFTAQAEVAEDACSAIVNLAGRNLEGSSPGQPQNALRTVLEKSKNDATRRKADRILQGAK
jgi:HEAT repeat protein